VTEGAMPLPPQDFDSYLAAQAANLSQVRRLDEFRFVERVIELYEHSFRARARRDPDVRFAQLLTICHGALLSAAASLGRALPGDAIPVTRRAVEAASLAAAFKADEQNYVRWLAEEQRLARWQQREQGVQPKGPLSTGITYPPGVAQLRSHLGTMSDAGAHLTPEFISTQRTRLERGEGLGGRVIFSYFETEQRELERMLLYVASIHLEILDAFDDVFNGAFRADQEWMRRRAEIATFGKALMTRFRPDLMTPDEPSS
jgi:hypothetical protein